MEKQNSEHKDMELKQRNLSPADLQAMLECPVCMKTMKPRIFQCENGHVICKECCCRLRICPTCRSDYLDIRCLFAEQLSLSVQHNCSFDHAGCTLKLFIEEIENHESICIYRPFRCPFLDSESVECLWQKPLYQFEEHVFLKHPGVWQLGSILKYEYDFSDMNCGTIECKTIILAFNKLFWVNIRSDPDEHVYLLSVQHVGPKDDAEEYKYVVTCTFLNKKMKASFETEVHSFSEDYEDVFSSKYCYVLPYDLIEKYITGTKLVIKVEIMKES